MIFPSLRKSPGPQELDIFGYPVLKILPADVKDGSLCQRLKDHGSLGHAGQNRHLTHKVDGLILLDHEHIAILKFIDDPDPIALLQLLRHIF